MSSTAERIRQLMATHGLNQGDFAERIGLDASKMSKSLSGTRRFSLVDLSAIADEFGVSIDWLSTGEKPELAVAARRAPHTSVAAAITAAQALTQQRADLGVLGVPSRWRPLTDTVIRPGDRLVDQGATLAEAALQRVGAGTVTGTTEQLITGIENAFGPDVAVVEVDKGLDGLAVAHPDAKLILLATSNIPARQRFTLVHELCHVLMSDDQGLHKDEDIYSKASRTGDSEMRANAFAAAFLMPEPVLREAVTGPSFDENAFCALAHRLHVSPSALAYRLGNLRLIDTMQVNAWRHLSNKTAAERCGEGARYALAIGESLQPRLPRLLVADTYQAYQQGLTTLRPYANLLGVDVEQLRADLESAPEPEN